MNKESVFTRLKEFRRSILKEYTHLLYLQCYLTCLEYLELPRVGFIEKSYILTFKYSETARRLN